MDSKEFARRHAAKARADLFSRGTPAQNFNQDLRARGPRNAEDFRRDNYARQIEEQFTRAFAREEMQWQRNLDREVEQPVSPQVQIVTPRRMQQTEADVDGIDRRVRSLEADRAPLEFTCGQIGSPFARTALLKPFDITTYSDTTVTLRGSSWNGTNKCILVGNAWRTVTAASATFTPTANTITTTSWICVKVVMVGAGSVSVTCTLELLTSTPPDPASDIATETDTFYVPLYYLPFASGVITWASAEDLRDLPKAFGISV